MPLCSPGNCVTESTRFHSCTAGRKHKLQPLAKSVCDFSHLTVITLSLNTTQASKQEVAPTLLPALNFSWLLFHSLICHWSFDYRTFGTGKMASPLRVLTEDLSSVLSDQVRRFTTLVTPASEDPTPSSGLREYLQSYICTHIYTHNLKKIKSFLRDAFLQQRVGWDYLGRESWLKGRVLFVIRVSTYKKC